MVSFAVYKTLIIKTKDLKATRIGAWLKAMYWRIHKLRIAEYGTYLKNRNLTVNNRASQEFIWRN